MFKTVYHSFVILNSLEHFNIALMDFLHDSAFSLTVLFAHGLLIVKQLLTCDVFIRMQATELGYVLCHFLLIIFLDRPVHVMSFFAQS
jgi:hypothetical protein